MSYEKIRLEKGMYYQSGRSFTQVLESLDPSADYAGTALAGTDAFERQLVRYGIVTDGVGSSRVDSFFRNLNASVLFPEYITREVRRGMDEVGILPGLIANVTTVDTMDYRSVFVDSGAMDLSLADVAESASIPSLMSIKTREKLVSLKKRGRMLEVSYETLRAQSLSLFSVMLRQLGASIRTMQLADAVDVICNGDGNNNSAKEFAIGDKPISGTSGTLGYTQLVEFCTQLSPLEMNTLLVHPKMLETLLSLPEMQHPFAGVDSNGAGILYTPFGARILCSTAAPEADSVILGLDRRFALEMVQVNDLLVECDKLIDRQLAQTAITSTAGFAKINDSACAMLYLE